MHPNTAIPLRQSAAPQPDLAEIHRTLLWLYDPGDVGEMRVLHKSDRGYPETISGYYNDMHALAANAAGHSAAGKPVYVTLNPVNRDLLARRVNRDEFRPKNCTQDGDIFQRNWLAVDVDAVRPSGVSATDSEHEAALELIATISAVMQQTHGWPAPIMADSGNGGHLLWYCSASNHDDVTALFRRVLECIAREFDTDAAKVDKSVYNASRIWKVYGTVAYKGDHTLDRPHRLSHVLDLPGELEPLTLEQLALYAPVVAPHVPPHANALQGRSPQSAFDIPAWIAEHGIDVRDHGPYTNSNGADYRWQLESCPLCGESDHSAVILQMGDGRPAFKCHHNRCAGKGWKEFRAAMDPAYAARRRGDGRQSAGDSDPADGDLPEVQLPGGEQSISNAAGALGRLMASRGDYFVRGNAVTAVIEQAGNLHLQPVKPTSLASDIEKVAKLLRATAKGIQPATCGRETATLLLHAQDFGSALPKLINLSRCPVVVEHGAELVEVAGYDELSGVYAAGPPAEAVELCDARDLLNDAISDFQFATEGDKSRALAALVTPALIMGDVLKGRSPLDLSEADQSQAGKGFRNKLTAAIYRDVPETVSQQRRGVGSTEETFDHKLIAGKTFLSLDNIRGSFNSPKIEMFLTEEHYAARCAYAPNTEIDPKRVCLMFTSNNAEMTADLANRSSCVGILKQPEGYQFRVYPEGNVLDHIRANQPLYLGAVFAVIRAWHAAGMPRTGETRHDFLAWAQALDWIVQNLLGAAPLIDGHRETQQRMANPWRAWLRAVLIAVAQQNLTGRWLITSNLLDVMERAGNIEIPGVRHDGDLAEDRVRESAHRQIGRQLAGCFDNATSLTIDGFTIEDERWVDERSRPRHRYRVTQERPACVPSETVQRQIDGPKDRTADEPDEPPDDGPEEPEDYYDPYDGPPEEEPEEPEGYYEPYDGPPNDEPVEPDGYYDPPDPDDEPPEMDDEEIGGYEHVSKGRFLE